MKSNSDFAVKNKQATETATPTDYSLSVVLLCSFCSDTISCLCWYVLPSETPVLFVGCSSGWIRCFSLDGNILISQLLHQGEIKKIKIHLRQEANK